MFVVWVGALVTARPHDRSRLIRAERAHQPTYNGVVTVILLLTVWFANFAEALAEGRGKAKAASLRRTKVELSSHRVESAGGTEDVPASALRKGDVVRVERTSSFPRTARYSKASHL